jgi:NAD(P)-dependent dehydrogenase (short-subunit alcohol dehydrogenase family)
MTKVASNKDSSEKRVAVVTGALKGLGLQTARELAAQGYRTVLTGRDEKRGREVAAQLAEDGREVSFLTLDVSDPHSIERFAGDVLKKFGRVDVLVNNAGISVDDPADRDAPAEKQAVKIEATFRTNTVGPFLLAQRLVPQMIRNGYGRVVNVSSGMGQLSEMDGGYPAYRMSKTALNAVTRIVSADAAGHNVLVNSACPGWVRTDMGGPGAPRSLEQGAETIVWLATLPDGGPSGGFFRDKQPIAW